MRAFLTASLATVTIALLTASLSAAPARQAVPQNATPLIQLAQYGEDHHPDHPQCHRHRVCEDHHRHCHWACD